jgi:hypothetical protein
MNPISIIRSDGPILGDLDAVHHKGRWVLASGIAFRSGLGCLDRSSVFISVDLRLFACAVWDSAGRLGGQPDDYSMDRSEDPTRREGWIRSC